MAYIDSSIEGSSPLAAVAEPPETEEQEEAAPKPEKKKRKSSRKTELLERAEDENLARRCSTEELDKLGQKVLREYEIDLQSRKTWEEDTNRAMRLAMQITEPKIEPWPSCSNVVFPMIGTATISFAARTYGAVIQGKAVVKGQTWGSDRGTPVTLDGKPDGPPKVQPGPNGQPEPVWLIAPGEKRKTADRIAEFMSWQLLNEIPYWESELDESLHQIPVAGGVAKKTWWNRTESRPESRLVPLMNLVWNKDAPSFEAAPRHSERLWLYPHQIDEFEAEDKDERGEGVFLPISYAAGTTTEDRPIGYDTGDEEQAHDQSDPDAPQEFIEQHCRYDLDGDDYPEPLTVTVHKQSAKVVRIKARYDEEGIKLDGSTLIKIEPVEHYTLFPFMPSLDGGSYPSGWGQMLRHLNESINTTLNQMFDAGTLANSNTGVIGGGLGMASGQVSLEMGRFKRVTTRGGSIRDNIVRFPFEGPSPVLFQLLGLLVQAGEKLAGTQDILTGDAAKANAPPTTVLALIEQGLTLYTAIIKRVFRALATEFKKIHDLNRKHLKERREFTIGDESLAITPDDFRVSGGVVPIADPSQMTDMQRVARASALMTFKDDPLIDQVELRRRFLEALNVDRIDELLAPPDPMAQQLKATMAQLAIAQKQAELGRERAAEMKDTTQAYLNLALARAKASEGEQDALDKQLTFLRLQIEAVNSTIKAAAVDHRYHDTNTKAASAHADRVAAGAPGLEPGPTGPFPAAPGPEPVPGHVGAGVPALAPQSDNAGLPPLPQGPAAGVGAGLPGALGAGGSGLPPGS